MHMMFDGVTTMILFWGEGMCLMIRFVHCRYLRFRSLVLYFDSYTFSQRA